MMGKNLLIISFLLLALSLRPIQIYAISGHEILGVDIVKQENASYIGEIKVSLPSDSEPEGKIQTKLHLSSEIIANGFDSATIDNVQQDCGVEADTVFCNLESSGESEIINYFFIWKPSEIVENSYCAFVTGDRQKNIKAENNYLSQIVAEAKVDHPYIRKIVINSMTTDGSMRDVYADISIGSDFATLWVAGVLPDNQSTGEITFHDSYPRIAKWASDSGTYGPYFGSLASFGSRVSTGDKHRLFAINTKKKMVSVESATWELCSSRDVEREILTTSVIHEVVGEGGDKSVVKGGDLVFGWDNVTYQVEPTSTPTKIEQRAHSTSSGQAPSDVDSTKTPTPTPTPTKSVVASTLNPTSTPTPTVTGVQTIVDSSQRSVVSSQSAKQREMAKVADNVGRVLGSSIKSAEATPFVTLPARRSFSEGGSLPKGPVQEQRDNHPFVIPPVPIVSGDLIRDLFGKNNGVSIFVLVILIILGSIITYSITVSSGSFSRVFGIRMTRVGKYFGRISTFIKKLIGLFIILFCVLISARTASAQAVTSYKITDAFTMHGTGAYTGVINISYIYVTKNAAPPGRYVISRTPDGTGEIKIGNYLQAQVKNIYYANIKSYWVGPADSSYVTHYICPSETALVPTDVSHFFPPGGGTYSITFRFISSCYKNFPVSDLYLVFVPDPTPTPTATPTITPTPTPTPFTPFLDLPWDYRSKGLKFSSAATAMTSYFDHEYPLLSMSVVGLSDALQTVVSFESNNRNSKLSYSSHDGYDYAKVSKAYYGDPQLAAAGGIATLRRDYWQMGNAIFVDHGNGFQTRYYHMDGRDLIVEELGREVGVKQGQMIGRIGYTGNVDPGGKDGAHIHFMVVYDKNGDGNFDDNIPDGLIDPYGWMGDAGADPWERAVFQSPYGTPRTGMRSTYLWKYDLYTGKLHVTKDGGSMQGEGFGIESGGQNLPEDDFIEFAAKIVTLPLTDLAREEQERLGVAVDITMKNAAGDYIRYSNEPFNVIIDFMHPDIKDSIKPESLKVISSSDGGLTWQDEPTLIDWDRDRAIATVDHTTIFTLVGEKKDKNPPVTTLTATGLGKGTHFRTDVTVVAKAVDEDIEDFGVDYTLYTLDAPADWTTYLEPLTIASSGAHFVKAFSADKSGNIGGVVEMSFTIEKSVPEIGVRYATESGKFVFESEDKAEMLRQAQHDTGGSVSVEDEAGNINELQYQESSDNNIDLFRAYGGIRNKVTINYEPSVYGISDEDETGYRHEYLYSGGEWTRVIYSVDGEALIVSGEEIAPHETHGPLQLVTENAKLVLVNPPTPKATEGQGSEQ